MHVQLTTASFPYYSLDRVTSLARRIGVQSVELALTARMIRTGAERVSAIGAQHGVRFRTVLLPPPLTFPPERNALTTVERFVRELPDCEVIVLPAAPPSATLTSHLQAIHTYRESFGAAARHLAIENPTPAKHGSSVGPLDHFAQFRRVAEEWDLCFTYDISAGAAQQWVITEPLLAMGHRLRNIHFSDVRLPTEHLAVRESEERLLPTQGMLPLRAFLRALARKDYSSFLTLDAQPRALRAWWPPTMTDRLTQAVAFCRSAYGAGLSPAAPLLPPARVQEPAENESA